MNSIIKDILFLLVGFLIGRYLKQFKLMFKEIRRDINHGI